MAAYAEERKDWCPSVVDLATSIPLLLKYLQQLVSIPGPFYTVCELHGSRDMLLQSDLESPGGSCQDA